MKRGFTLVELLVVLVVIGVIVGLILPNTLRAIEEANERECTSNLRAINTAIQLCFTTLRDATQCDTIAELGAYLDNAPTCPFGVAYAIPAAADTGTPSAVTTATHFATWPPRGIDHQ
jgi:prepilin-type N-terminal cleavage/methylation domain-containing protein